MKEKLQHKIDTKTKPLGSLGMLEEIALQIGMVQNTLTPSLKNPSMLVFAADHGLTEEGIATFPREVTWQMVLNFLSGGAAINVFCRQNNIGIKVVDAGVDYDFDSSADLINAKIARGTKNMLKEPAMSSDECDRAIATGASLVEKEAMGGCNIIGFGEMGIGNTSAAALLFSKYSGTPVEECVGRGAGLDDEGVKRKTEVLVKVAQKYSAVTDPKEILRSVGGLEIAMICGGMLEACKQKMIILVDGFISTSAFLAAHALQPDILDNAIFCHKSNEQAHRRMLDFLGVSGLLDIGMRLGEGTGAAVAYPLVESAVAFLNEMASFESAGVSKA